MQSHIHLRKLESLRCLELTDSATPPALRDVASGAPHLSGLIFRNSSRSFCPGDLAVLNDLPKLRLLSVAAPGLLAAHVRELRPNLHSLLLP
jgi:hypothetical protein